MREKNQLNPERPDRELTPEELLEKLKNPSYLPTSKDIFNAFSFGKIDDSFKNELFKLCFDEKNPIFEFLNEEFLNSLGDYLSKRVESFGATKDRPITILEVGAGNGRLSHFLQQKLKERISREEIKIIVTDSGEAGIRPIFSVEKLNHKEALEKYKPQIVICSWMPPGIDFSADFRSTKSLREYILIGEPVVCGDFWLTWGTNWALKKKEDGSLSLDEEKMSERENQPEPYKADGFEWVEIEEVSKHQICRADLFEYEKPSLKEDFLFKNSKTISFRRKEK